MVVLVKWGQMVAQMGQMWEVVPVDWGLMAGNLLTSARMGQEDLQHPMEQHQAWRPDQVYDRESSRVVDPPRRT